MTKILIVDDLSQNRYVLATLLEGHGYAVQSAANGAEALLLAQSSPPDLIISDVLMPVMDGFEFCRRCKRDEQLKRVPFVVYTATYTDTKDERLALGLGADRFLTKPQKVEALLEMIRDVLHDAAAPRGIPDGEARREIDLLLQHNDALVRKLEKKVQELETTLEERRRSEAERLLLQKQLQVAQKLESLGRLAGGVAHDFNNLLTVVLAYTNLTLDALPADSPLRADLDEINKAGERAAALTHQLLAFGRRQILAPDVLDLNAVVVGIEAMLRPLIGENIVVDARLADDLGTVVADAGQIEQVIMNLAINARDAMPRGGKLTIGTANVEVDEAYADQHVGVTPGLYVLLTVGDSGSGMDAATQQQIFEPFFTTKDPGKGTGLGLAIVHGIVKQSGGTVGVDSELGRGTTFKVYLPRMSAAPTERAARPAPSVITGHGTVLVVEDDAAVRRLVERVLSRAGYEIRIASSGDEALQMCEQLVGAIDLLLTDVVMPEMSGRELSERLTVRYPGLETLYMSGYADSAVVHHSLLERGMHFIGKPFAAGELTRKVREVLDGH